MQVKFNWEPKATKDTEDQLLMMESKTIKSGSIAIAIVYSLLTGKHVADFLVEGINNKDGNGFANRETVIRHVEKKLGIYKAPKKKTKK